MYKVFLHQKALIFTEKNSEGDKNELIYSLSDVLTNKVDFVKNFQENKIHTSAIILFENPEVGMNQFFNDYEKIEAAGGLVRNGDKYLFIKRLGYWDIPKGKMEANENPSETAIREVEEECGISSPTIDDFICCTYHTYTMFEKNVLKKTYWYLMSHSGEKKLVPQTEEDITEAVWLKKSDLNDVYENTYPSILDVLKQVFKD